MSLPPGAFAWQIAAAVAAGEVTAVQVAETTLARIERLNPALNAFTDVTAERALARAAEIDEARTAGRDPGPLAGVPFAVKNLYDIAGFTTRAGSLINRDNPPAEKDAVLIERLDAAGAVLLGGLNMGEYAYDFTGQNVHDGHCRNPHDMDRMTGGSSSGSGSATAAGLAPVSLGSDTNGSVRVPAALCGIFGLKPTYGRLPRTGTFPFCDSLDHLGPFARCVHDLALAYDALQGPDAGDHACAQRAAAPVAGALDTGVKDLRIAVAGGYFATGADEAALGALAQAADALGVSATREVPFAAEARAAAYLVTNAESSAFHLERLRTRADDFDPETRDRFLAGALLPAAWYVRAQQVRRACQAAMLELFREVDVLLAPSTPCAAPRIGQQTMMLDGREVLVRPHLGLFTQPISCIGLPVCAVPVFGAGTMPLGVQIIAPPWREDIALRVARRLERDHVAAAHAPAAMRNLD